MSADVRRDMGRRFDQGQHLREDMAQGVDPGDFADLQLDRPLPDPENAEGLFGPDHFPQRDVGLDQVLFVFDQVDPGRRKEHGRGDIAVEGRFQPDPDQLFPIVFGLKVRIRRHCRIPLR